MLLCKTSIEILLLFYCFSIIDDFLKQAMQESNVTLISFTKSKLAMNLVVVIFMQEFPIFHYKVRRTMIFFPISPYNLIHLLLLFSSTQHNTRMNFLFWSTLMTQYQQSQAITVHTWICYCKLQLHLLFPKSSYFLL